MIVRTLALLALFSLPARADLIVGRVVDSSGAGVGGVDIDVENLGPGGDPTLAGDGTDPDGFFSTTLPAGVYRVLFKPPPPPTTTHLSAEVATVVVAGTADLGVVSLPPGVSLAARVVNDIGVPIVGVDVDVRDAAGNNLDLVGDTTDVLGEFIVAVPAGDVELRLDATPAVGGPYASHSEELVLTGDTTLADVTLPPGVSVSGLVLRLGGGAVVGADLDVVDPVSGEKRYTPGDNTDGSGAFSVVIPAGTWDVEVCPKFADGLVATTLRDVAVGADTVLPTTVLEPGFVLSGVVRGFDGVPVAKADVDLFVSATSEEVTLCGDDSAADGSYAVVVPSGNFTLRYTPPYSVPYGSQILTGAVIAGPSSFDATLPACPFGEDFGSGLAGTGGVVPYMTTSGGTPRVGNPDFAFELTDAVGGSVALFAIGVAQGAIPLFGGTLLVDITLPSKVFVRNLVGPAGVAGAGSNTFRLPLGIDQSLVGITVYAQFSAFDSAGPQGFAMSDGLIVTFCE